LDNRTYKHLTDYRLKQKLNTALSVEIFDRHCQEVSEQLGIHKSVVRSVLYNYAFYILKLMQFKVITRKYVKVNIPGYFSFQTLKNNIYNFVKT